MATTRTIYRSVGAEQRVVALYDAFVERWPVAVEQADLESRWGSIHVLSWGPQDGPPLILCHAASMAATSWLPNAASLAEAGYRCHAVDYIGEANMSRLEDIDRYPKSGTELARLYASVMDSLGVARSAVLGASAGGHVSLRLALAAPERVARLVLLGPMGITSLGVRTMLRMAVASMFPRRSVVDSTSRWALGSSAPVSAGYGEWFDTVLESVASPPRVARPVALKPEELAAIRMPVLLVLGDHDNLVGDPERATRNASAMPDVRVQVLDSAHLVAVEQAHEVNASVVDFLGHAEPG